jgi:hypothetical protein
LEIRDKDNPGMQGNEYFVRLMILMVLCYRSNVSSDDRGASIITLGNARTNKARMVEYLNATANAYPRQLDSKKSICDYQYY